MTHIPQWAKLQMDFRAKVHDERRQELEHIEAKKLNPLLPDFVRSDDYQWQVEQQEKNAKYSAPGGRELQIEDRKKEGKEIFELIENQRKIIYFVAEPTLGFSFLSIVMCWLFFFLCFLFFNAIENIDCKNCV